MKDLQEIIDHVDNANSIESINLAQVFMCLANDDWLIRSDIIAALRRFSDNEVILYIIIAALNDSNEIVRCEACDSLWDSGKIAVGKLLELATKDKSALVRMHAIGALCDIYEGIIMEEELVDELRLSYKNEKAKNVRIAYFSLFYQVEENLDYVRQILKHLNDTDYSMRCLVSNTLTALIDDDNVQMIYNSFKNRLAIEPTIAVKSTLQKSIEIIEEEYEI